MSIPKMGPALFSVAGLAGQVVAPAGSVGPVSFLWPRALFCTGFLLLPLTGNPVDAASLRVQIEDESFSQMISDGQRSFSFDALALHGQSFRPFPLQRPVGDGDVWRFTVSNVSGGAITIAAFVLYFEEGLRR